MSCWVLCLLTDVSQLRQVHGGKQSINKMANHENENQNFTICWVIEKAICHYNVCSSMKNLLLCNRSITYMLQFIFSHLDRDDLITFLWGSPPPFGEVGDFISILLVPDQHVSFEITLYLTFTVIFIQAFKKFSSVDPFLLQDFHWGKIIG